MTPAMTPTMTPLATLAAGAVGLAVLHRARNRGALPAEAAAALPGDELVPEPAAGTTQGIDVYAPSGDVWRWLVQIGQDRGGMYGCRRLDGLLGLRIRSADRVEPRWQDLSPGDRVVLVPRGWRALPAGYAMTVDRIVRNRLLVLRQAPPEHAWNAVWTFAVISVDSTCCRLLAHTRVQRPESPAQRLALAALEPLTTIMTRRMLRDIKHRAEASAQGRTVPAVPAVPRPVEAVEAVEPERGPLPEMAMAHAS
jgi:hypothetical protein